MSTQAILVHGWAYKEEYYDPSKPTASNSHWFPWLSKELMVKDIHTVAIEMPRSYYPVYEDWKKEFERYDVTETTLLVGHSCGAGFLIRWLSENKQKVGKVVLVAPWVGVNPGQPFDENFFKFDWDKDLVQRTNGVVIFNSDDDGEGVQESVRQIRDRIKGVEYREFSGKGHFTQQSLGGVAFPELLEELLS